MAIENNVSVQNYNGTILNTNLLSGGRQNLLLNALGSASSTTVTENNNSLQVGETVQLGDGREATVLGSGTAQPGISLLGAIIPTGTARDVVILETSGGQTIFLYPDGAPNILSAVALLVTATPTDYTFPGGIICFAAGTSILTDRGEIAVEDLQVGDLVMTRDSGPEPLIWIGSNSLDSIDLTLRPELHPIRIKAGALDGKAPESDLVVSPQHRILVRSKIAQRMFDADEILVAAKHLLELEGIDIAEDITEVAYYHFLFSQHQVVISNGAYTESLYTGPQALKSVGSKSRAEILTVFPELENHDYKPPSARILVSGRLGRQLAARHLKNRKPLFN